LLVPHVGAAARSDQSRQPDAARGRGLLASLEPIGRPSSGDAAVTERAHTGDSHRHFATRRRSSGRNGGILRFRTQSFAELPNGTLTPVVREP